MNSALEPVLLCESLSLQDTFKIAQAFEPFLKSGDILCLEGDLGAGKTAFVSAFCTAKGLTDSVSSPTFTLLQTYGVQGDLPIHHFDVYRLSGEDAFLETGLDEFLGQDGICIIEWPSVIESLLKDFKCLYLNIRKQPDSDTFFQQSLEDGVISLFEDTSARSFSFSGLNLSDAEKLCKSFQTLGLNARFF